MIMTVYLFYFKLKVLFFCLQLRHLFIFPFSLKINILSVRLICCPYLLYSEIWYNILDNIHPRTLSATVEGTFLFRKVWRTVDHRVIFSNVIVKRRILELASAVKSKISRENLRPLSIELISSFFKLTI